MAAGKTSWMIPLVAIVSLFAIFTWQLGIFNINQGSTTATGYAKIKPQLAGTGMNTDGSLNAIFTNGVGAKIRVRNAAIQNLITGQTCYGTLSGSDIPAGENFRVTATGCGYANAGDVYNLRVSMEYDVNVAGTTTSHTETGTLRGPYEGSGYYEGGDAQAGVRYSPGDDLASRVAMPRGYGYGMYGQHKSFDFGSWWPVVAILCMAFILEVNGKVGALTEATNLRLLSIYGFIFLLCSSLIFLFGADHLFNVNERSDLVWRLRYGWMIEGAIYFAVAVVLIGMAEYGLRKADRDKSLLAAEVRPITTLLLLGLLFIYPYRAVSWSMTMTAQTRLTELGWLVEVVILALLAAIYTLIGKTNSMAVGGYEPSEVMYYGRAVASIFFLGAAIFFIWGVNTLVYSPELDLGGVAASAFLFVGGMAFYLAHVKKKAPEGRVLLHPVTKGSDAGGGGRAATT
ncbi:MAG: hypothetical protein V1875_09285 [Candidatus Altiarchaeota archaeon]